MKKKILLASPKIFNLYELIEKNLVSIGYEVTVICPDYTDDFKYPNLKSKIINFIKKTFFNDHSYKKKLLEQHSQKKQSDLIRSVGVFDYALFIRCDFFNDKIIEEAKKQAKKIYSYSFDGLNRSPKVYSQIKYFDRFYVFNYPDLQHPEYKLYPATNFYFDINSCNTKNQNTIDFHYIGTYIKSRFKITKKLHEFIIENNFNSKFTLISNYKIDIKVDSNSKNQFHFSRKIIPYKDYLSSINSSTFLIDLAIIEHSGLSFRFFESIKYKKKLITNNSKVENYDFYSPQNIFIIRDDSLEGLLSFLQTEYQPLPSEIIKKYSFSNWIKYILEIDPNINFNIH